MTRALWLDADDSPDASDDLSGAVGRDGDVNNAIDDICDLCWGVGEVLKMGYWVICPACKGSGNLSAVQP